MERSVQSRIRNRRTTLGIGAAAGLGLTLVLSGCSAEEKEDPGNNPNTNVSVSNRNVPPNVQNIADIVFTLLAPCEESVYNQEVRQAFEERATDAVVFDGRCDVNPDAQIGIYSLPTQESESVGLIGNRSVLPAECTVEGQYIQNMLGVGSKRWVRVSAVNVSNDGNSDEVSGFAPGAWVQGEENIQPC